MSVFKTIPLETLLTPYQDDLLCPYKNHWWVITNNNEAIFYKALSHPQCNTNKCIAQKLSDNANEQGLTTHIQLIPWIFVPYTADIE